VGIGLAQLRCRTEFSFREAFGKIPSVAARLQAIGAPAAAIVDGGTWGHVKWAKELAQRNIKPLFGIERPLLCEDGKRPRFWLLATDMKQFYRLSTALNADDITLEQQLKLLKTAKGVVRFAGSALTDPDTFDFIDINPASALSQARALKLHKKTKKPLVITSDNSYPAPEQRDAFLAFARGARVTPQWILSMEELRTHLSILTDKQFGSAVETANKIAHRCASVLPAAPIISVEGDLKAVIEKGRKERLRLGHLARWTPAHQARLDHELKLIRSKNYESYFLVVADLVQWAKTNMLVGPARGSSAGSLACYLLRITEVDPLEHGLLFERFIDVSRNDLPDIDIDFSNQHAVFEYLPKKYGRTKVARIGSINNMRAKTVIARVCERLGIPDREKFDVLDVLIEYSSGDSRYGHSLEDTLSQTEPGKRFAEKYPEAKLMFDLENHASHTGVHAAGVIVCNEPVIDYCTVGSDGVAQLDKPDAEAINLLKIDALGLRTLAVIEDSGAVTAAELYALKLDDPKVLKVFNDKHYAGIFQFEGQAQRRVSAEVLIESFKQIDHITALARPGPLGGGASQKYIARAAGREPVEYRHPSMAAYLAETMGVVLYQEQVMRICVELGKFDWKATTEIRKAMSGRKGKEYFDRRGEQFVAGAAQQGIPKEEAEEIWAEICTFGAWGMNKSHTVSYAIISYWCAWLKAYHPLAYFAAGLRNAKDDAQAVEILREAHQEGHGYVAFDAKRSAVDWAVVDGELVGGFKNLVGFGPAKAVKAVEARRLGKLDFEKLTKHKIKFTELYPMQAEWGHAYEDPTRVGCAAGSRFSKINELPPKGDVLVLARVDRKELRDENETIRVARRGGRRLEGQTLFLDVFASDDSGVPITLRFDRFKYKTLGAPAAEKLKTGDVVMVRGFRIQNFAMVKVKAIRCLNRPEVFQHA
jgi:DNA-directed DNA polymerase III PolC